MTSAITKTRGKRKEKQGVVISGKMEKTVIVRVDRTIRHPQFDKVITRAKKYYAHDESDALKEGDSVIIRECRPYSKLKRWLVIKKIEGKS